MACPHQVLRYRTGDIMREQLQSDLAATRFDPMRLAQPVLPQDPKFPGRVRIGPDWFAFCGNWMTEWELTGDAKWRDKILAGVDSILAMKYWMRSGVRNGYNPDLGKEAVRNLEQSSAALLASHGMITIGPTPTEALHVALVVERTAQIVHGARLLGGEHPLPEKTNKNFRGVYEYLRKNPMS